MTERQMGAALTERQLEVLRELEAAVRQGARRITALDCGGMDGSHHSATLAQLCRKGLATRRKYTFGGCSCKCGQDAMFGHRCKGSFSYGITEQGINLIRSLHP